MHIPFALLSVGRRPSEGLLWELSVSPYLTICSHIFVVDNKDIPNTDTCPTLWLNGQDIDDDIKYFSTPTATDETLQDTTNKLTHLKVKQFHIEHKIKYMEWCNTNHIRKMMMT